MAESGGSGVEDVAGLETELSGTDVTGPKINLKITEEDTKCSVFIHSATHQAAGFYFYLLARRLGIRGFIQDCACERCQKGIGFEAFLQAQKKQIDLFTKVLCRPSSNENLVNFNDLVLKVVWRGDDDYRDKGDFDHEFEYRFAEVMPRHERQAAMDRWAALLLQMDTLANLRNLNRRADRALELGGRAFATANAIESELKDTHRSLRGLESDVRRTRNENDGSGGKRDRNEKGKGIVFKTKNTNSTSFDPSVG